MSLKKGKQRISQSDPKCGLELILDVGQYKPATFVADHEPQPEKGTEDMSAQSANVMDSIQQLTNSIRGEVILPSHPRYDSVRRVWNYDIDLKPASRYRRPGHSRLPCCT
jgi:hypothetical protein